MVTQHLIMGDGLAGWLCAATLSPTCNVTIVGKSEVPATPAQYVHVHTIPAPTLAKIETLLDREIGGWSNAPLWQLPSGVSCLNSNANQQSAVVDMAAMLVGLQSLALARGVRYAQTLDSEALDKHGDLWSVRTQNGDVKAAHLIDASGSHHVLGNALERLNGHRADMDEIGAPVFYASQSGTRDTDGPTGSFIDRPHLPHHPRAICTMDSARRVTLTVSGPDKASADPAQFKDKLAAFADIEWAPKVTRHTSLGARLLRIHPNALAQLPPALVIGDALMQGPPSLGHGVTQALNHVAHIKAALELGTPVRAIQNDLSAMSRAAWLMGSISQSFNTQAA